MTDEQGSAGAVWPAEVRIRVERPETLLYLLFVRDAWGFAPLGDVESFTLSTPWFCGA